MQIYRKIDKDIFLKFIAERNISLRSLDRNCNVTDKTIRRALDYGLISISSAINICLYLNSNLDETFGEDPSEEWARIMDIFQGVNNV